MMGDDQAESDEPYIIDETDDFAVVWKPARMHCAPLRGAGEGETLLDWYAAFFPRVLELEGRKKGEGGLVHRLDFETRGLVLFAREQRALDFFLARQEEGAFVKEYEALCIKAGSACRLPGFPPLPAMPDFSPVNTFTIKSFFRPFGPGRKQVRPVTGEGRVNRETAKDRGNYYRTEITCVSEIDSRFCVTARIRRGFRHQIRCHLAWLGYPILNDPLYGTPPLTDGGFLALIAGGIFFPDNRTGEMRMYCRPGERCRPGGRLGVLPPPV